jgi:hypothetical protein
VPPPDLIPLPNFVKPLLAASLCERPRPEGRGLLGVSSTGPGQGGNTGNKQETTRGGDKHSCKSPAPRAPSGQGPDRHLKYSLFQVGPFANKWLLGAVGLSLLLTMLVIYLPPLQNPFHTFGLSLRDWGFSVGLALTILIVVEAVKFTAAWRGRERATQPG